jgi:Flp pilus assembly protein TadG
MSGRAGGGQGSDLGPASSASGDSEGTVRSRGSVTAEFAVLLPAVALMLAMVVAAGTAGVAKLRCIDAARSAARLAARHESSSTVLAAARSAGPRDATVRLAVAGELVRVQVTVRVSLPLPGRPSVEVDAMSVARLEEEMGDG